VLGGDGIGREVNVWVVGAEEEKEWNVCVCVCGYVFLLWNSSRTILNNFSVLPFCVERR
jgi:hypothetical protein